MDTTKLVRPSAIVALFTLAALSATPTLAQTTVFDNGNPDLVSSYFSDPGTPQFTADDFTFTATTTFDTVQWYGVYANTNTPTAPDLFTISFFNIAFGTPNSLPRTGEVFSVGAPARVDTGTLAAGFNIYRYEATLSSPITMVAGTYGIQIANNTAADTNDNWGWTTASQTGSLYFRPSQASGFTATPGNLAYQLSNSTAVVVPEAGTLALVGIGCPVLGALVVRRRK